MTKHLTFKEWTTDGKRKTYEVINKYDEFLGSISYHPPWKCYVFEPIGDSFFSAGCMNEISDFIKKIGDNVRIKCGDVTYI